MKNQAVQERCAALALTGRPTAAAPNFRYDMKMGRDYRAETSGMRQTLLSIVKQQEKSFSTRIKRAIKKT